MSNLSVKITIGKLISRHCRPINYLPKLNSISFEQKTTINPIVKTYYIPIVFN